MVRWPACPATYPPAKWARKNQLTAVCTRRRGHLTDHDAQDGNGNSVQKWWRGWEPPPSQGGPPLLTRKQMTANFVLAMAMIAGQVMASHYAVKSHGWLMAGLWACYVTCWVVWFRVTRDNQRDRRRVRAQADLTTTRSLIYNRRNVTSLLGAGWYAGPDGRHYKLPPGLTITAPDGAELSPAEFTARVRNLEREVENLHDIGEIQQRVLVRQVLNPRG